MDPHAWYLAPGMVLSIATRTAAGRPTFTRATALRLEPDQRTLVVFVAMPEGLHAIDNLSQNGELALSIVRPSDYRAVQILGTGARILASTDEDEAFSRGFIEAACREAEAVGVPAAAVRRFWSWEGAIPVAFVPTVARDQTPGTGAGEDVPL